MTSYLAYGAVGLGLALAVLAYRLLTKEQDMKTPRQMLVNAIYVFMGFSLVLTGAGFVSEYVKSDASSIDRVRAELSDKTKQLTDLQERYAAVEQALTTSRTVMQSLMDIKQGKVSRLKQLDPKAPEYVPLVQEIQADLERLDKSLKDALSR